MRDTNVRGGVAMKRLFAVTLSVFVLAGLAGLTVAQQGTPNVPTPQAPQTMMSQGCPMMPMGQMGQACMRMMHQMSGGCVGQSLTQPRVPGGESGGREP